MGFHKAALILTAQLAAIERNKTLADADEAKLDAARIQHSMGTCAQGQAVVLKADGARNAFLTGPLDLKPGVTLVVGAVNLKVAGEGVTVTGTPSNGQPNACTDKFVPIPRR